MTQENETEIFSQRYKAKDKFATSNQTETSQKWKGVQVILT